MGPRLLSTEHLKQLLMYYWLPGVCWHPAGHTGGRDCRTGRG